MENAKVSIIIPVYNVSEYLRKCLESVINQSLKEIQIIIVNDASPDPLDDKICQEYARSDDRINYIKHPENKGAGAARNTALLHVTGAFVTFVDSDDFIHKDMCKVLYEKAITHDCDVVQCNFTRVDTNSIEIESDSLYNKEPLLTKDLGTKLNLLNRKRAKNCIYGILCSKLIKTSASRSIKFIEIAHEDFFYMLDLILRTKQILLSTEKFYYYRKNPESISNNPTKADQLNIIRNVRNMKCSLEKSSLNSKHKKLAKKYAYTIIHYLCYQNARQYKFSIPFTILAQNFIPLKVKLILIIRGVLHTLKLHDILAKIIKKITNHGK